MTRLTQTLEAVLELLDEARTKVQDLSDQRSERDAEISQLKLAICDLRAHNARNEKYQAKLVAQLDNNYNEGPWKHVHEQRQRDLEYVRKDNNSLRRQVDDLQVVAARNKQYQAELIRQIDDLILQRDTARNALLRT